jgi:uncharacterized membrane-anchored protein
VAGAATPAPPRPLPRAGLLVFAAIILIPAIGWSRFGLDPIVGFWFAHIVTRPLGASCADWFSRPTNAGLGLGDGLVGAVSLLVFIGLVSYLAITKLDVQPELGGHPHPHEFEHHYPIPRLVAEPE